MISIYIVLLISNIINKIEWAEKWESKRGNKYH